MRLALLCLALLAAAAAGAQDRQGRVTPGEWVVDHHRAFGPWDAMCDHRVTGEMREERCYIRYVDVFSPRPDFAAQFLFVTPGPRIEIGIEPGTRFPEDGFRIERDGAALWSAPQAGCLVGLACIFEDAEAEALLAAMLAGDRFAFDFTDRHGAPQSLRWNLAPFAAALADFEAEAARRQ